MISLKEFVESCPRLLVITGAGCSSSSGIPTYRGINGAWLRSTPIQHQDFLRQSSSRQRYWARSFVGWPAVARAKPNAAHRHLVQLESLGIVKLLVTQNIDRLHQFAGHKNVIDLHGRLDQVICLSCGHIGSRAVMQERLIDLNPCLSERNNSLDGEGDLAPDGDAPVEEAIIATLKVPYCEKCDGILKPNVVFFGGTVKKEVVHHIYQQLDEVDGLLAVGTSLRVFSGYRICKRAHELGKPIASINPGKTRADGMLSLKVSEDCGAALGQWVDSIS